MSIPQAQILVPSVLISDHRSYHKKSRRRRSRMKVSFCATANAAMAIRAKAAELGVKPAQIVKRQHVPLFIQQMRLLGESYAFDNVVWADRNPEKFRHKPKTDQDVKLYVHQDDTFIFTGTIAAYDFVVLLGHEDDDESHANKFVEWWS